jgi:hypothetical protein
MWDLLKFSGYLKWARDINLKYLFMFLRMFDNSRMAYIYDVRFLYLKKKYFLLTGHRPNVITIRKQ